MLEVPREIGEQFAAPFSEGRQGFSAKQLYGFFSLYSSLIQPIESHRIRPSKVDYFVDCLYKLRPNLQYAALTDLCKEPPEAQYPLPNKTMRDELLRRLHSHLGANTVGITYSRLSHRLVREAWLTAHSRIANSPSAAITASRTLLETILNTLIEERESAPDNSGNLGRLLNRALQVMELREAPNQAQRQILKGLAQVVDGIATISNNAGDRHGKAQGFRISDEQLAECVVNAAGTIGLFVMDCHLSS